MEECGSVRVVNKCQDGKKGAKRVRVTLRVTGGVMDVKILKDEGRWGGRQKRRVESPNARVRRGATGGRLEKKACGCGGELWFLKNLRRGQKRTG